MPTQADVALDHWCKANVSSKVKTGSVNHRTVCGNQFPVKDGVVNPRTRRHAHTCPACLKPLFGRANNAPTSLGMSKTRKLGRTGGRNKVSTVKSNSARHQGSQTAVAKRIEARERALHAQVWSAQCCCGAFEAGETTPNISARNSGRKGCQTAAARMSNVAFGSCES